MPITPTEIPQGQSQMAAMEAREARAAPLIPGGSHVI